MESPSTASEEQFILENWTPEPLVPDVDVEDNRHVLNPYVITSKPGKYITIDGRECLNMGTHNYLGLADDERLGEACIESARKYGVGSCGPRAFYGTMNVHLDLEKLIADFLNVQEAALYSFGFSTIASAIPAYAKPTDVIYFDERCNFAIQQGIVVSKSRAIKFKHNDVDDLEMKIKDFISEHEKKNGKKNPIKSFLLVEAIYAQTGRMCPLKEFIAIAKKYKVRVFIDESRSFGVLGETGRGITQLLGIDIQDIDLIMASLENALCGFGGFCAGSSYVVDHQRLAGTAYCFSASLPPLQCQVAIESLKLINENPSILKRARENFVYAHQKFSDLTSLKNISHPLSPVKVLVFRKENGDDTGEYSKEDEIKLDNICRNILDSESIAITVARYLVDSEMTSPVTSIRVSISACLSNADIDRVFFALERFSSTN